MSDKVDPPREEKEKKSPLDELADRLSDLLGSLLHPPVLVPVPARQRRRR